MTGDAHGPPRTAVPVRIARVAAAGSLIVIFCSAIEGILTHWIRGRSHACPGPDQCQPSDHRSRTTWKGYASARAWEKGPKIWRPVVVEITECLEEILRGRTLPGEQWMLSRDKDGGKGGEVTGCFLQRVTHLPLLEPFPLRPPVLRFYHPILPLFGVANPIPPKLTRDTVSAPGPALELYAPEPETLPPSSAERERLREMARQAGIFKPRPNGKEGANEKR